MFEPGDDPTTLATAAVRDGADALGMAGGDGSQAAVAAVAAEHGLPYVCVPAGTRNHFAFDLGIDRNDVVGALDAFVDGDERRIDLGRVNGQVFVNNVAMGVYGAVVQAPAYRDHKVRTMIDMLPELVGPRAEAFDLRFTGGRRCVRHRRAPARLQQPLHGRPPTTARHQGSARPRVARCHRPHGATATRLAGVGSSDVSGRFGDAGGTRNGW